MSEPQKSEREPKGKREQAREDEFFYFDLADESHIALAEQALREAMEAPLEPITEVTKVDY